MERKHLGAANELIATVWLLQQGYEVFRNVSQHGIADLIVLKDGYTGLIDVKSCDYRDDGSTGIRRLSKEQVDKGVWLLSVFPDGKCYLEKCPSIRGNYPPCSCLECSVLIPAPRRGTQFCSRECRHRHWSRTNRKALALTKLEAAASMGKAEKRNSHFRPEFRTQPLNGKDDATGLSS
jgi:Holliday junction resolvase-like predicted endonuclease